METSGLTFGCETHAVAWLGEMFGEQKPFESVLDRGKSIDSKRDGFSLRAAVTPSVGRVTRLEQKANMPVSTSSSNRLPEWSGGSGFELAAEVV
jgi:hypothetical protein